ncbi:hypothetical protein HZ326_14309 [Fusarium oxysporum f. sp. albedinis]|nr:hypothetical protein HZ326_14309 [Fusarium oxysporum f. sp. albedinis]
MPFQSIAQITELSNSGPLQMPWTHVHTLLTFARTRHGPFVIDRIGAVGDAMCCWAGDQGPCRTKQRTKQTDI